MPMMSFHVTLTVKPDKRQDAQDAADDLFQLWRKQAKECEWDESGACELVLRYNKDNGDFAFDSGGERDMPTWMADDTHAILNDIGRHAACPTVVQRTMDGSTTSFAVGGTPEGKKLAAYRSKIEAAVLALEEIRESLDDDFAEEVKRVQVGLQALLANCPT